MSRISLATSKFCAKCGLNQNLFRLIQRVVTGQIKLFQSTGIYKLLVIGLAIDNDLTLKDYINILFKRASSGRCPLEEISFNKALFLKMVFGTFRRSHIGYSL